MIMNVNVIADPSPITDKGYAWVMLGIACALRMLFVGPDAIMGVLLLDLTERYSESGALVNTIVSVQLGISCLSSMYI